jgi:hypothetical protein
VRPARRPPEQVFFTDTDANVKVYNVIFTCGTVGLYKNIVTSV